MGLLTRSAISSLPLAAAAVATVGLYAPNAFALALGPITVQSALGEPLRAEIDLPQITPAEADSLRVTPATPETFRAQGMEYSPVITRVQVQLQRRPDGRTVLRLSSDRAIVEPFLDVIVEVLQLTPAQYAECVVPKLQGSALKPTVSQTQRSYRIVVPSKISADNVLEEYKAGNGGKVFLYERHLLASNFMPSSFERAEQ